MHNQIKWPTELEVINNPGYVDTERWWNHLESKILEGIIFKDVKVEKINATSIAPWIAPACRGQVVNTEHLKCTAANYHHTSSKPIGCPKKLATLIFQGVYNALELGAISIQQLKEICNLLEIPKQLATTKV